MGAAQRLVELVPQPPGPPPRRSPVHPAPSPELDAPTVALTLPHPQPVDAAQQHRTLELAGDLAAVAATLFSALLTAFWVAVLALTVLAAGLALGLFVALPLLLHLTNLLAIPLPVTLAAVILIPITAVTTYRVVRHR